MGRSNRPVYFMLSYDLGYRPPSIHEIARIALRRTKNRIKKRGQRVASSHLPATLISDDPLISYSGIAVRAPLGLASHMPKMPRDHAAWFLISPTWTMEDESLAKTTRGHAVTYRFRNSGHSLIFLCNTPEEVDLLRSQREAAIFHNATSCVSELHFKPLTGVPVEFDAIYNAKLASWKRHELSLGVARCAFVFYRDLVGTTTHESEIALISRHRELAPGHVFINEFDRDGVPVRLDFAQVNWQLNRATVGLCLSETEGAMLASVEYMLAGLSVVTTPSRGGRHVYYDDEYCLTVPPDPRSVAEAVAALKAKQIPRDYIRMRTLKKLERDRSRFIDLVNAILAEGRSTERVSKRWPFEQMTRQWIDPTVAVSHALSGTVDGSCDIEPRRAGTPDSSDH